MKYKILDYYRFADSTSNIGRMFPQIQTTEGPIGRTLLYLRERDRDILPSISDLSFDRFIIEKSAKKTDALSASMFSAQGYIFSKKLIELLQQFELPNYKIYRAIIQKKGTDIFYDNYYAFKIEKSMYRYLAFDSMEFIDVTDRRNHITNLKIGDVTEFEDLWYTQKRRFVLSEDSSYIFTDKFPSEIDVFGIGAINSYSTFISKRLREAFISNNITGLDFKDDIKLFQLDE